MSARDKRGVLASSHWFRTVALAVLAPTVIVLWGCGDLAIHDTQSLLVPAFKRSEVIGFLAGFGTTFAAIPDLLAMLKRQSSAGMHPRMAAIMCLFQVVWVYYGLLIASRPVVVWNMVAVVVNALSVGAYFHFAKKERHQTKPM
jgi:uncharacterized protein with PQ loop repeat